MDDLVLQAMAKWPKVPACTGWLGLDARGQWWMRDDAAQALGAFSSGAVGPPGPNGQPTLAKGSLLRHDKLIDFIGRNYLCAPDGPHAGQWFFQNGPQRVYVELEATPFVMRVGADYALTTHTGVPARMQRCVLDEHGRVYADTHLGFGLIHTMDVALAADAIESGLWVPQTLGHRSLPLEFGYVRSPQAVLLTGQGELNGS